MNRREINFIRCTAKGILKAMDELKDNPDQSIIAAMSQMLEPWEGNLRSEDVGFFAVMYLAANDWEVPEK